MEVQTGQERYNFTFIEPKIILKRYRDRMDGYNYLELFHIVYIVAKRLNRLKIRCQMKKQK